MCVCVCVCVCEREREREGMYVRGRGVIALSRRRLLADKRLSVHWTAYGVC